METNKCGGRRFRYLSGDKVLLHPQIPTNPFNGIMFVGEASGAEEEKQGTPFVGASGKLLTEMMGDAGIDRDASYITNAFMSTRPPGNDISFFFVGIQKAKKENIPYCTDISRYRGKYLREYYRFETERLRKEIEDLEPKIIVALGATALWATVGIDTITAARGNIYFSRRFDIDVLPTFHPAAVIRDRKNKKPLVIEDLMKAESY